MTMGRKACACGKPKSSDAKACRDCFYKRAAENTAANPNRRCACGGAKDRRAKLCERCLSAKSFTLSQDREKHRAAMASQSLKKRYEEALKTIERQERELHVLDNLTTQGINTHRIEPRQSSGTSECTVVAVASDWHIEERVNPGVVSGLNEHNLEIAKGRATKFFQGMLRLTRLLRQDTRIDHAVVPLLGDFISNDIHEEFPENNDLTPMLAIAAAQDLLASGIEFLLNHSKLNLTLPCHSGNHARTTRTTRFSGENGHSLEWLMYRHLAGHFRTEPRVTFIIPEGPHSYLDIYGRILRFHHGHMIKFQGGIGGIFIPAYKAIAQWNKARKADLDVFGHFHQRKDGGNFISNGSNIGYNGFALSIKADYEEPAQQLFMVDKKRGRTCTWPIFVK